jgi:hypothetical protein
LRATEVSNSLRGAHQASALSSRCRLKTALLACRVVHHLAPFSGETHIVLTSVKTSPSCRLSRALADAKIMNISLSWRVQSDTFARAPHCSYDARIGSSLAIDPGPKDYCPPMREGASLVCFTDGSFQAGGLGGFAAIFCDARAVQEDGYLFCPDSFTAIYGPSPSSGANYAAEVRAILAALQSTPVDTDLRIVTDCLSALQSLAVEVVSEGRRLRSGARSLITSCRNLLWIRAAHGANTTFDFVNSHTGALDWRSRGNEVADSFAAVAVGHAPPFLAHEEEFVFWHKLHNPPTPPAHVSGNLRTVLRDCLNASLVTKWCLTRTQGEIVRMLGPSMVTWLDTIRRSGDGNALLFALQMTTLQIPTPCKTLWSAHRDPASLTCPLCKSRSSPRHPFVCPYTSEARRTALHLVRDALCAAVAPITTSDVTTPAHRDCCLDLCASPLRWLDLTCPSIPLFYRDTPLCLRPHLASIEESDRWAGLCGLIPTGLRTLLLLPDSCAFVVGDPLHIRAQVAPLMRKLQFAVLEMASSVLDEWCKLCALSSEPPRKLPPWLAAHLPNCSAMISSKPICSGTIRRTCCPTLPPAESQTPSSNLWNARLAFMPNAQHADSWRSDLHLQRPTLRHPPPDPR